jgi:butyryl-CoA dehydrogenase
MEIDYDKLTARLARFAQQNDTTGRWPVESLDVLRDEGCFSWIVPARFGGSEVGPVGLTKGYEALARGCMSTALIFTQHDAAVDLVVTGGSDAMRDRFCPKLSTGEILMTVGISQLTTSHQGGEPVMKVSWDGETAVFDGFMPWVTSAGKADWIATGGVLEDGTQLLACVHKGADGLKADEPMRLAALESSWTSAVRADGVRVPARDVIRGPVEKVLAVRGTVRPTVVSSTGIGLAGAMVDELRAVMPRRSAALNALAEPLIERYEMARAELYESAHALTLPGGEKPGADFRSSVNDLLVRLAICLTTLAKGTGYLQSHPAQRLVRQSLFFLVWSAPESVQTRTLNRLLGVSTASGEAC